MVSKFMNVMDSIAGRLIEKVVDAAEFLCPSLKKFLSWEFIDDGSLFAIHVRTHRVLRINCCKILIVAFVG